MTFHFAHMAPPGAAPTRHLARTHRRVMHRNRPGAPVIHGPTSPVQHAPLPPEPRVA